MLPRCVNSWAPRPSGYQLDSDNGGQVVKHMGDGFLARFSSGKDATAGADGPNSTRELDFSAVGGIRISRCRRGRSKTVR